jgi:hypothetical protein
MKACVREQPRAADVVVMQMSENDQFDGSRVDAFARQTVLQQVVDSGIRLGVALRCARAGTRSGIDDDRLASAAQQPRNARRVQARGTAVLAVQKTLRSWLTISPQRIGMMVNAMSEARFNCFVVLTQSAHMTGWALAESGSVIR